MRRADESAGRMTNELSLPEFKDPFCPNYRSTIIFSLSLSFFFFSFEYVLSFPVRPRAMQRATEKKKKKKVTPKKEEKK